MPRLLLVHHTPSPATHTLLEAARAGAGAEGLDDVELVVVPALGLIVPDVLAADGIVLGTTANFGYMSGALKHAFDTVYYPVLDATQGRPYGLYVHGGEDVDGAVRSVERIVAGLGWRQVADHVRVTGAVDATAKDAVWELVATVAANL